MTRKKKILVAAVLVGLSGFFIGQRYGLLGKENTDSHIAERKVTIYKSPTCGCCGKYISHLKRNGYDVETVMTNDMDSIKAQYNIPDSMESCHTTIVGNYFVEGHVPLIAIDKLLDKKPNVDGIALPGMPSGSPGMPGPQIEPFNVFTVTDGQPSSWLAIN